MLTTVLDTSEFPAADRFGAFNEWVAKLVAPTRNHSEHVDDFRAVVRAAGLGTAGLFTLAIPEVRADRSRAMIRGSDPECYHVALITGGRHCFDHGDRQVSAGTGELVLYDTSRPYTVHTHANTEPAACTIVAIPRTALKMRARDVETIMTKPVSGTSGTGGLLARFITGVTEGGGEFLASDAGLLGTVLTDLVAALIAHELELTKPVSSRQVLLLRIRAYIEAHLADPDLGPARIAAAHHISVRFLHKLFEEEQASVAATIRARRLERARRDLADPELRDQPVHVIGARWGFRHASHFTRAFGAAFGYPPSRER